jgi:hypothetical protein
MPTKFLANRITIASEQVVTDNHPNEPNHFEDLIARAIEIVTAKRPERLPTVAIPS